jgi:hypothetical protein
MHVVGMPEPADARRARRPDPASYNAPVALRQSGPQPGTKVRAISALGRERGTRGP